MSKTEKQLGSALIRAEQRFAYCMSTFQQAADDATLLAKEVRRLEAAKEIADVR